MHSTIVSRREFDLTRIQIGLWTVYAANRRSGTAVHAAAPRATVSIWMYEFPSRVVRNKVFEHLKREVSLF